MKLSELREEFEARGFDDFSEARLNNYLNDAYLLDICEDDDWPFLEETKEGGAPLEIEDLRAIEYVIDSTQETKPAPIKRGRLTDDIDTDLTTEGSPEFYYLTGGNTVNVYPANTTDEFLVRYYKVPEKLKTEVEEKGYETPLLPERWHSLIVDGAVARGYEDRSDFEASAVAAKERFDERLEKMRESLGMMQHDAPDDYVVIEDPYSLHS